MKARYRVVLLDADNTLFDFDEAERRSLRHSLEARGGVYNGETLALYLSINRPLWEALHRGEVDQETLVVERFRRFGGELGLTCDPAEWNREYLAGLGDCAALLPGAEELLEVLKPHCRLALATNGVAEVQRRRLAQSPIAPYFEGVFISGEMGVRKPDRDFFDRILAEMKADRGETVMVGDTLSSDIQGAVNASIDSIWYSPEGGLSPLPTYRAESLERVAELILGGEGV